ncbi:MAG: hypothetical protein EPN22_01120 [Nitrospirae bacterium]|nr:MAG: hypothetical protein EPN22_01120 [Nitrospirota bacterium]
MTRSKKENKEYERLVSLGPERLARMLLERADWDEGAAHTVEQALAESNPLETVVGRVKKGLGQYTGSRLSGSWNKSSVISRELDHLRLLISDAILPKSPATAAALFEKLIERHVPVFNNVDDSNGLLGDVFRQAVRDWGNAWYRRTDRKAGHLAGMVFNKIMSNDYGMYDHIVPDFSGALGADGIAELEKLVRQELAPMPPVWIDENRADIDKDWFKRVPLCRTLEEIADLRNDPDGYIEAVTILGRPEPYAGDIAERLISAKRFEDALTWLGRSGRLPRHDVAGMKAQCLVSLGKKDEARELLWHDFLATLSGASYSGALKLTPESEIDAKKEAAIAASKQYSSALTALSFLLKQGFMHNAADLVVIRWQELNGEHYYAIRPAAEKLETEFPLAAALLRRRLAEAILEKGVSKYYGYAVNDLKQTELISRMVQDWQGNEDQSLFMLRLKARHGKKSAFWALYERK